MFCFFFWSNRRDGRAISRRGCLFRLVEVVGVAARGILWIYTYIYCTDFVRYIVETHTNTGGHGITDFLWVIGYRDQSRNVEEEWRCIFVFVIIDIDRYNRCKIYSSIYSLVLFYMVYMGRSRAPSLIYRYIYQYQYQIGSVIRFSEQSRLEEFNHNQSINQWRRIGSGIASFSYRFYFGCCCVSFCVLCNSCVVLRFFLQTVCFVCCFFVCCLFVFCCKVPQGLIKV